jgi:sugar/nucleoside kinase (ribokinase family)
MDAPDMTALAVIGDIFYDYVCDLSSSTDFPSSLADRDVDISAGVVGLMGGNALQFAVAAIEEGFSPVTVVGKIGGCDGAPDVPGASALNAMRDAGVEPLLAVGDNAATGRAMITYLPHDRRFMISDPGANAAFESKDINDCMLQAVTGAGLVHVSGYTLVQPARRSAIFKLIEAARSAGATIALDVVPHDIDRYVTPAEMRAALARADWIMTAEVTARRLFDPDRALPEDALLMDLSRLASTVALFRSPDKATVLHGCERREHELPYTPGPRSRGQSARAQAHLLARYLPEPGER